MRRLAAVTVTALLSAAALTAGSDAAQAVSIRVLGGLHLKRVDTLNGQTHVAYLLCTSITKHGEGPVIHGAGGLKDATSACEELAAVDGDLDALSVHPAWLPPMLGAPVEVRASGSWKGAKVTWTHRYPNGGWLAKRTGDVFAF